MFQPFGPYVTKGLKNFVHFFSLFEEKLLLLQKQNTKTKFNLILK